MLITDAGCGHFTYMVVEFLLYQIFRCVMDNLVENKRLHISSLVTTKWTVPKNQTKCHHLHRLNTLRLLGKQMGFALCLEGHQLWALPDQQRKCLLLKIPSCLSPQQMWQKWLLNLGTSFPLVLAITTRLILSKALAQVLKYCAWCLNVSAEAQTQEKACPLGSNLDVNDGDVSWRQQMQKVFHRTVSHKSPRALQRQCLYL